MSVAGEFMSLENESRAVISQLIDLCIRRNITLKVANHTLLHHFEDYGSGFEVWVVESAERLMNQLRMIVAEMAVFKRKLGSRNAASRLYWLVQQEYLRKVELLETLRPICEFEAGQDQVFFENLLLEWRCDAERGYLSSIKDLNN